MKKVNKKKFNLYKYILPISSILLVIVIILLAIVVYDMFFNKNLPYDYKACISEKFDSIRKSDCTYKLGNEILCTISGNNNGYITEIETTFRYYDYYIIAERMKIVENGEVTVDDELNSSFKCFTKEKNND